MGKNILTGWLQVTVKDFRILIKNKFLLLIYSSVVIALLLIALFICFYIYPQILDLFELPKTYPSIPNYMVLGVVFSVTIFMMSQGAVSITDEGTIGTFDRMKIMNMPFLLTIIGKMLFYYLSAFIMMLVYNLFLFFLLSNWNRFSPQLYETLNLSNILEYLLLWPLIMVLLAGLFYGLVRLLKGNRM